MKVKTKLKFQKSLIIIMSFIMIIAGTFIFQGCQKDDNIFNNDLPYLSLNSNVNFSKLSEKDKYVIGQVLHRLEISRKDGFYCIKQTSGKQINVSEELFNYVSNAVNYTNKILQPKELKLSIRRLKSDEETPPSQTPAQTDCMAHAIGGTGVISYEQAWITLNPYYPNGVPMTEFASACLRCIPNGQEILPSQLSSSNISGAIIVFKTSDGNAHAVNGHLIDIASNTVIYQDNQNNNPGYISRDDIAKVFVP